MKNRSARNRTRRNRNIGTSKSGRGQNNRLVIPGSGVALPYFERLGTHSALPLVIQGRTITLIVELPRLGFVHSCTPDDLVRMLELIPAIDWEGIEFLVLRQPTRKQALLEPVWGRLVYSFEFRQHYAGAVVLEAQDYNRLIRWPRKLQPDDQREVQRLREDGLEVIETKRDFRFQLSSDSVRSVQLFRSLLHEIGHWVDYKTHERSEDVYWNKSRDEKETYAHRYAQALAMKLKKEGRIPFPRLWSDSWPEVSKACFFPTPPASRP
jgi:hypothetical protein